jgi:hypothetical protein
LVAIHYSDGGGGYIVQEPDFLPCAAAARRLFKFIFCREQEEDYWERRPPVDKTDVSCCCNQTYFCSLLSSVQSLKRRATVCSKAFTKQC